MNNLARKNTHLNEAIDILDQHLKRCKYDYARAANTLSHVYSEFVDEEILKCMMDPRYYLENYHVIKTKDEGFKTLYPFFDSQEIIYSEIMSMLAQGKAAKCLVDKARQLGSSTLAEGLIFHRTVFNEAVNTLIVAQNPSQSDYLFSMSLLALENMPWWMQPRVRYRSKARYLVFDSENPEMKGLNSTIYVDAANKLCLCPGTMVATRRGLVPIETIVPGDYVFDPTSRPVEVVAAIARRSPKNTGKKITVWHNAGFPISGTDGHPLMTTGGLKNMEAIKKGDSLVLPFRKITAEKIIPLARMSEWAKVRLKSKPNPMPTREWGFLCGLYLAEGTVHKDNGRCVSLGLHARELHLAERASAACGVKQGRPMVRGNKMVCRIHSSWLGTWLSQQFGDNNEKHIPDWVFGCGPEFCVGLLEGALLGDGHKCRTRNDLIFVSVRPMLALRIRELALALGFGLGGIMKSKTTWEYKGVKKKGTAYRVEFGGDVGIAIRLALGMPVEPCQKHLRNHVRWAWIPGQNAVSVEVKSVEECPIDIVYDIQVASEDHLYTLPACVTHNTGVSVGRTIHCSHLSELSDWDNAEILTEQIFPTMSGKNVIAILESTARGADGFWYDFWNEAVDSWGDEDWEWKPIFVEWFRCRDYSIPIEDKSKFTLTIEEQGIRDKVQRSSGFNITDEQLNWRRIKRKETIKIKGDDTSFLQEYPLTHEESFQASGLCAFPKSKLYEIMNTSCCDPLWFGELVYSHGAAQEVKTYLTATFDESEKGRSGNVLYLKGRVIPPAKKSGTRLRVWELPEPGEAYYVAGDPAHGLEGGDFSCAQIIRIGHGCEPDVQVAEWNGWINPTPFGHILVGLAKWYNGAELSVEMNAVGERTYIEIFRILEYSNLFRWKHYDKVKNFWSDYMAWLTTSKTRDLIITNLRERIMENTVVLYSHDLLKQMLHFTADEDGGKFQGHATNDDRVMAMQICLWCAHDSDYGKQAAMAPKVDAGQKKYYVIDDLGRVVHMCEQKSEAMGCVYTSGSEKTHPIWKTGWSIASSPQKRDFNNTDFSPVHDRPGPRQNLHYAFGIPAESIRLDNLQDYDSMGELGERDWMSL